MLERTRLACIIGVVALVTVVASAQSNRWNDPYQKALKAIDAKDYTSAITLLQQAIAAEPKASANKLIEGVFRTDYFPYYYLGIAYLETRQYDKAQENFAKARPGLSKNFTARLDDLEKRRNAESALARRGGSGGNGPPATVPKPAGPNPGFEPAIQAADAALAAKHFGDAVTQFETAKRADTNEFSRTGAQARLDEAERGVKGQLLADEGQQLLSRSQLTSAKARFQQADQQLPGQKIVSDGLSQIKQREDNYQRLKSGAEQDARNNNFKSALDKFAQAKTTHPDLFAADNLDARVKVANDRLKAGDAPAPGNTNARNDIQTTRQAESKRLFDDAVVLSGQGRYADAEKGFANALSTDPQNQAARDALDKSRQFSTLSQEASTLARRGDTRGARDRLTEARGLDQARFDRENLGALFDRVSTPPSPPPSGGTPDSSATDKLALRNALVALLQGNAQQSAAILEPAVSKGQSAAALHAYLGVAYATQALSAPTEDDGTRALREKALAQFRLAIKAQRNYQLSPRVVSPKIVELFEQVRAS